MLEGFLLIRLQLSRCISDEFDFFVWNIDHFSNHSVEETGLTGSYLANDHNELAFLDLEIDVLEVHDAVERARGVVDLISLFECLWTKLIHDFAANSLSSFLFIFVLFFRLFNELILLFLVKDVDSPAEVAVNGDSKL